MVLQFTDCSQRSSRLRPRPGTVRGQPPCRTASADETLDRADTRDADSDRGRRRGRCHRRPSEQLRGTSPRPPSPACPSTSGPSPRSVEQRHRHLLQRGARRRGRRQQRQAPQGPLLPRLLRHPRRRVRRRLPALPDRPRDRRDPGLARRHRRHRQPRATRWPTTPASAARGFRVVALLDADPEPARRAASPASTSAPSTTSSRSSREHGVAIGVIATPGGRRAGRLRPDGRGRHHAASSTSRRPCSRCPTGVDVRKVDLSIELQILAYHEQRKAADSARDPRSRRSAMSVLVVGISHKSAPVDRARAASPSTPTASTSCVRDVADSEHVTEATVLATCNRVEIYADVDRFHGSVEDDLAAARRARRRVAPRTCSPHLYVHYDDGAVSHLFHVAAGLDSMVVGESQILGQTREALRARPGARHRRPGAQRALPAGAAGRQARRTPRPTSTGPRRPWSAPRSTEAAAGGRPRRASGSLVVGAGAMAGLAVATVVPPRRRRDRGRQPHRGQRRAARRASTPPASVPLERRWPPSWPPPTS